MQSVSGRATSVQSRLPSRESWIDTAKGWGILLVVLGHALRGLQNAQLLPTTGWSHALDAWIYSFHMPLFFLLSGFFMEKAVHKPLDRALKDRAKTLLWPYLVWSVLQTLVQIRMSSYTTAQYDWMHLLGILWKPVMQFWFLYVLLLLSLLWLGLRRIGVPAPVLLLAALVLHLTQNGTGVWAMWDLVCIHGVWFAAGAVLGIMPQLIEKMRLASPSLRWTGILSGFALTSWGAMMQPDNLLHSNILWAVPGVLASLWLAMSLPADWSVTRGLGWIGRLSLEIYLVHTLASATMRAILLHGFKSHDVTLHLVLASLAGIMIPVALVLIGRRLQLRHVFRFGTVA
ncbi:MAG TPA: acyltransferase [Oligoflexus sp.]|uniref:acyltransferase family protein n=1 Tax=Oligoflexus sp. TaxID=1971216 RepID=UPI002D704A1C|nr:acyltransferase [Oligoflexus sp.]HYX33068.1 acyltransferase [Oligoflexus sp.]